MPFWNATAALEPLLEPQERFDRLCAATRRRFGRRVVDLSYANAHEGPDDEVRRAMRCAIDDEQYLGLQYTPFGGRTTTRRLIADRLGEEYGLPFTFRDVILTPGATAALNIVVRTLIGPSDVVLVVTPCWLDYPLYLRNLGVATRFVACRDDKHLDLDAIGRALDSRTRAVLFSHPCCPTGVLYSKEEIDGLAALLTNARTRWSEPIYVISDEVHRHMIWSGKPFHSPASSYDCTLTIYSFGKALFLQGQRTGYVAVSPRMPEREALARQLERATRIMGFGAPTTLMQRAICRLMDYRPPLELIAVRQTAVRNQLKASGYEVCDGDATVFVYAKAPIPSDFTLAERLAAEGVLVMPSTLFHEPGYFRISVTAEWASLLQGLSAFEHVLAHQPGRVGTAGAPLTVDARAGCV